MLITQFEVSADVLKAAFTVTRIEYKPNSFKNRIRVIGTTLAAHFSFGYIVFPKAIKYKEGYAEINVGIDAPKDTINAVKLFGHETVLVTGQINNGEPLDDRDMMDSIDQRGTLTVMSDTRQNVFGVVFKGQKNRPFEFFNTCISGETATYDHRYVTLLDKAISFVDIEASPITFWQNGSAPGVAFFNKGFCLLMPRYASNRAVDRLVNALASDKPPLAAVLQRPELLSEDHETVCGTVRSKNENNATREKLKPFEKDVGLIDRISIAGVDYKIRN